MLNFGKFYALNLKVSQAEFACDTKFKTNYREMILNVLK